MAILTGTGPVYLSNQAPRIWAVDDSATPTELYLYAKKVENDQLMERAIDDLIAACASGATLDGLETQWAAANVTKEVSDDATDLLRGYTRLVLALVTAD